MSDLRSKVLRDLVKAFETDLKREQASQIIGSSVDVNATVDEIWESTYILLDAVGITKKDLVAPLVEAVHHLGLRVFVEVADERLSVEIRDV